MMILIGQMIKRGFKNNKLKINNKKLHKRMSHKFSILNKN